MDLFNKKNLFTCIHPQNSNFKANDSQNVGSALLSLRHPVNGDFCDHSSFVFWHQNLTTFVSWTFAKFENSGEGLALIQVKGWPEFSVEGLALIFS